MRLGERVLSLLRESGRKQKDLADYLDIGTSTVNGWKETNRNPTAEHIIPICDFFGVSANFLLAGKEYDGKCELRDDQEILLGLYEKLNKQERLELYGFLTHLRDDRTIYPNEDEGQEPAEKLVPADQNTPPGITKVKGPPGPPEKQKKKA